VTTRLELPGPPALSPFRLAKVRAALGTDAPALYAEYVHLLALQRPLTAPEGERAQALLDYGPRQDLPAPLPLHVGVVVPRAGTISPWSSKATDIFRLCGLDAVQRVERGVRWFVEAGGRLEPSQRAALFDRMTERWLDDPAAVDLFAEAAPRPLRRVALQSRGLAALAEANGALGLALSDDELSYLATAYGELERDPTDAELMMFAQANSEHCRHKIFNASWIVDGEAQPDSLFAMIRNTHKAINGRGILSAYADNAAVVEGPVVERLRLDPDSHRYDYLREAAPVLMKVETHNHPTAIAPAPGAATGAGGEIRDEGAVGRGSKPKAGLTGFTTSHLAIPGFKQPWELGAPRPGHLATPLAIMLEGPVGAAAYNNEFGRPALAGYFRTFEQPCPGGGGRWRGYHKPVMIAGGVGSVRPEHVQAEAFAEATALVVLGGPAMLIGLGGGAASSLASGDSAAELDFASVQRGNAEMERRCQEVIDACTALGAANPIRLIHDVGAGGLSNALPELAKDAGTGAELELRRIPSADPAMSPLELWCNEAQERYVLAIASADLPGFEALCRRERCPYAVVGHATAEAQLRLQDELLGEAPVDLPLTVLFGNAPKLTRRFERRPLPARPLQLGGPAVDAALDRVLAFPAVASKQFLVTIGDRSITGLVAREQMVGPWQVPVADAAVTFAAHRGYAGEAFAMGERPPLALVDPAASARMAVAEALTNLAAAGAVALPRVVLSANWMAAAGEPQEDQALFDAVAALGRDFCPALGIAIPVGKDSLSMRTRWAHEEVLSPLTLIVSAFVPLTDVRRALTPALSRQPSRLLLVDLGRQRLGGSALAQCYGQLGDAVPDVDDTQILRRLLEAVAALAEEGLLLAYHDRSDGGLITAALEMAFAGRCGLALEVPEHQPALPWLFNEEVGVVLQVAEGHLDAVRERLEELPWRDIGAPRANQQVTVQQGTARLLHSDRATLQQRWAETSYRLQRLRDDPACADQEFAAIAADDPGLSAAAAFDPAEDVAAPFVNRGAAPRVAVLREQGVNGQLEMAAAFHAAGFAPVDVHMSDLLEGRVAIDEFPVVAACGGFSYGDVLGGGGGWAKSIRFHDAVAARFEALFAGDALVLGVCNGCQMLAQLKALIPGAACWPRFVRNRSEQFEGRTVLVRVNEVTSPWLAGMAGSVLPVAVAHGEGCAEFDSPADAEAFWSQPPGAALQYVDNHHRVTERYPANPNGAPQGLAGVTAADGRVLALMPHPERVYRAWQNPWRDPGWGEDGPWLRLFRNARVALG